MKTIRNLLENVKAVVTLPKEIRKLHGQMRGYMQSRAQLDASLGALRAEVREFEIVAEQAREALRRSEVVLKSRPHEP